MSGPFVPGPPSNEPVVISREVLQLLALVDISLAARRVLDVLLALNDEHNGTAEISQNEMCAALGASKPTVNRAFKELRACGLAWRLDDGRYQLHPLLTQGRIAAAVMSVPEIQANDPASLTQRRRARFTAQLANLPPSTTTG
ncbi:MarR family transcriptional regulator [Streptomyces beihaiensis]|uniref:Helix-turn-helix domain-containing protein n=1 Tax=Streptomyces beihaiensis TaxID=2984495 RepID=A0ABT3TWB9_9ACTN|nr:MarR family transcriptional regulator [Streptomyces beihaiensis]MCX3061342.1 helix-turn-helix domain-containing protein [Streptomyces beihaiensis]